MNESDVVEHLRLLLDESDEEFLNCQTRSYQEDGVLTDNDGLVLRLEDGSEFQITVVRSR